MTVSPTARRDLYAGFMMMDINKDGSLNSAELMLGFQELMGMTLPQSWAKQLMTEIGQVDGRVSYLRFVNYFENLLEEQLRDRNQKAFDWLCNQYGATGRRHDATHHKHRNGEVSGWPHWDGLTTGAQDACTASGYCPPRYPPPKSVVASTKAAADAKAVVEELAADNMAERKKKLKGRRNWQKAGDKLRNTQSFKGGRSFKGEHRTQQKRDLDWKTGFMLPPGVLKGAQQVEDADMMTFDDWMLMTGADVQIEGPTTGPAKLKAHDCSSSHEEPAAPPASPRTQRRRLRKQLTELGLPDRLTSNEMSELTKELLHNGGIDLAPPLAGETAADLRPFTNYRTTISRQRSRAPGRLKIDVLEARDLPKPQNGGSVHAYAVCKIGTHLLFQTEVDRTAEEVQGEGEQGNLKSIGLPSFAFEWSSRFEAFDLNGGLQTIRIQVWDNDISDVDKLIGTAEVELSDWLVLHPEPVTSQTEMWVALEPKHGFTRCGEVRLAMRFDARDRVRDPTTWTVLQHDDPNHLGSWCKALPEHKMALITSDLYALQDMIDIQLDIERETALRQHAALFAKPDTDPDGAGDPNAMADICVISRRGRGFGEAARFSNAMISPHKVSKLLGRQDRDARMIREQRAEMQKAAAAAANAAAKRAAVSLATLEPDMLQAQQHSLDTTSDGYLLAASRFSASAMRLMEAERHLVQHAGGVDGVVAMMYQQLTPAERKRFEERASTEAGFASRGAAAAAGSDQAGDQASLASPMASPRPLSTPPGARGLDARDAVIAVAAARDRVVASITHDRSSLKGNTALASKSAGAASRTIAAGIAAGMARSTVTFGGGTKGGDGRRSGGGFGAKSGALPKSDRWWLRESSKAGRMELERRKLEAVWTQVDADQSGSIDMRELDALIVMLGLKLSQRQRREAMAEMDGDGSGEVSLDEFTTWWTMHRPGALIPQGSRLKVLGQGLKDKVGPTLVMS